MEKFTASLEHILPARLFNILFVHKYLHFFLTGVTGVLLNLLATWILTRFVFGLEGYFKAYLIGIVVNLIFNFIVHTVVTFKAKDHVLERMIGFLAYSLSMTTFQAWIVKTVTPMVGLEWYLLVIASVIFVFSIVTFLLFKYFLFKDLDTDPNRKIPSLLLIAMFASLVLHIAGFFEVLAVKGLPILTIGDGTGYMEIAKNLWEGRGFSSTGLDGVLELDANRTPGLPLLLAPFMSFPWGIHTYLLLQTIFAATLLPFLVFTIGRKWLSYRAGMIGAWLIALEPQMMFSSWSPLTEIPYLIVSLTGILLYLSLKDWTGCRLCFWTRLVLSGILSAWAIYMRPGNFALFVIFFGGIFLWNAFKRRKKDALIALGILTVIFMSLLPWQIRNHQLTGAFGLSGGGWKNVYVDYLAAVDVVENGTEFSSARTKQKEKAQALFGVPSREDINSPKFADEFRGMVFPELFAHKETVIKLESLLLVSFFTNDNYYNQLIRLGFIEKVPNRRSPSQILLQDGLSGIPRIMEEMQKQYFVPIISRLYQFVILILAFIGLLKLPRPLALLLLAVIGFLALVSTVTGFGVEIRYRMPIMPILFLLVGHAIATGLPIPAFIRRMGTHES